MRIVCRTTHRAIAAAHRLVQSAIRATAREPQLHRTAPKSAAAGPPKS